MAIKGIIDLIYGITMFILSIYYFVLGNYQGCLIPIPIIRGTFPLLISISVLGSFLYKNEICKVVSLTVEIVTGVSLLIFLFISLILMLLNAFKTPDTCLNIRELSNYLTILTIFNFFNLVLLILGLYVLIGSCKSRNKKNRVQVKVSNIYEKIYSLDRVEINRFILDN